MTNSFFREVNNKSMQVGKSGGVASATAESKTCKDRNICYRDSLQDTPPPRSYPFLFLVQSFLFTFSIFPVPLSISPETGIRSIFDSLFLPVRLTSVKGNHGFRRLLDLVICVLEADTGNQWQMPRETYRYRGGYCISARSLKIANVTEHTNRQVGIGLSFNIACLD